MSRGEKNKMERRNIKRYILVTSVCFLMAMGTVVTAAVSSEYQCNINWRQFEGKTVRLILNRHPWQEAIEPLIPEFEKLTGIKVKCDIYPEAEYYTKVRSDLAAGILKQDVYMTSYLDLPKYVENGWIANLDSFLSNSELTDENWFDLNDFYGGIREGSTLKNSLYIMPIMGTSQVLIYRKDILAKLGLRIPGTLEEVKEVARKIKEETPLYGITLRGGQYLFCPLNGYVYSYGGEYFDDDLNPTLNSPQAIEATKLYVDTLKYAPPGVVSYDWDEINTALLSGAAAMFLDSCVIWPRVIDPKVSVIADKVGIAPMPAGPTGPIGILDYWSIGISNLSKNKEVAWFFLQWATSKPIQLELAKKGIFPPRASLATKSELIEAVGGDFVDAVGISLKTARPFRVFTEFWRWMKVVTTSVQKAILKEMTVEEALNEGQKELEGMVSEWRKTHQK